MRTLIIVYIFTNPSVISYMNTVYLDHIYLCKYPICSLCPTPWKSYFKGEKITPDYCKINQDHLGREMIGPNTVTLLKGHSIKLPSKYSLYSQTSTTLHLHQRRLFM